MAKLKRFEVVLDEGDALKAPGEFRIIRDTETGVCYLWARETNIGGITKRAVKPLPSGMGI